MYMYLYRGCALSMTNGQMAHMFGANPRILVTLPDKAVTNPSASRRNPGATMSICVPFSLLGATLRQLVAAGLGFSVHVTSDRDDVTIHLNGGY
jgi:hypothetical protein